MSTILQNKRITRQVRISERNHRIVKLEAAKSGKTISKLVDEIIEEYLKDEKVEDLDT